MGGRRARAAVGTFAALVTVLALQALPVGGAGAVEPMDDPVITSPTPADPLYEGFAGPFVVDFANTPAVETTYDYSVIRTSGGGDSVVSGPHAFNWSGSGPPHPLYTAPLPAGTGYRFEITDHDGHEATLDFTVRPGPAPTCDVLVPSRVRVNAPVERVPAPLAPGCAALDTVYATWNIEHVTDGFAEVLVYEQTSTDTWSVYDDEPTGTYLVLPKGARAADLDDVPQNTTRSVVRRDSRVTLSGSRSGRYVTLRARLTRYVPRADGFRAWGKRAVTVSYRTCRTCAWHRLSTRTTDRDGRTTFRFRAAKVREYQVRAAGTSRIWAPRPDRLRR